MQWSIDYEEGKKGGRIVIDVVNKIRGELADYVEGYQSYGDMLYAIGEKLAIAGGALYSENRYADKEYADSQYESEAELASIDDELAQLAEILEQLG